MSKKLINAFAGCAAMITLSACEGDITRAEKQVLGGLAAGAAANALGANRDESILVGFAGAVGIGILDRAQNAGCKLSSFPAGQLAFRSTVDGAYLNCESVGLNNRAVQELRSNPEWQLVSVQQPRSRRRLVIGGSTGFR